jgi:hypothetical protein
MKKAIVKSIIFMMVAICAQSAVAQSVVNAYSVLDSVTVAEIIKAKPSASAVQACRQYLMNHPQDTIRALFKEADVTSFLAGTEGAIQSYKIVAGDTLRWLGYDIYAKGSGKDLLAQRGKHYGHTVTLQGETQHTINAQMVEALDKKAVETRFEYNITDGRRRDVKGYQLSHAIDSPDGKVIKKAADKDGWGVQAEGTYQLASGLNAFGAKGGLSYTAPWWMVDLMAGVTRTSYSANAERAGKKYNAFNSEAGLWFQPARVDKYDQVRIWIGGGVGWEHYLTDSKETESGFMQSEGNYIYPHVGVKLEYRFFATGNSLYFKAQWRQKKWVIQNDGNDKANALEITVGGTLGFLRDIISH